MVAATLGGGGPCPDHVASAPRFYELGACPSHADLYATRQGRRCCPLAMLSEADVHGGDDPGAVGDHLVDGEAVERRVAAATVAGDIETGRITVLKWRPRGDTVGPCMKRLSVRRGYRDVPILSISGADVNCESTGRRRSAVASALRGYGERIVGRPELFGQPLTDVVTGFACESESPVRGTGAAVGVEVPGAAGAAVGAAVGAGVEDVRAAVAAFDGS